MGHLVGRERRIGQGHTSRQGQPREHDAKDQSRQQWLEMRFFNKTFIEEIMLNASAQQLSIYQMHETGGMVCVGPDFHPIILAYASAVISASSSSGFVISTLMIQPLP